MAAEPPVHQGWRTSIIPVAGCAVLGASTLSVYFSDLATQAWCGTNIVCIGFQADPRALVAGAGFLGFAAALLLGTALAATRVPANGRGWLAPLVALGVAVSFVSLVLLLTLNGVGLLSTQVVPVVIWTFLGIGYLILWTVTAFPSSLVGAWRLPARDLALVHGAVSFVATLLTLKNALVPGHFFL